MSTEPQREELRELYGHAVEEYRFEVRLNWDRMRYYLLFNTTILGAAAALLRFAQADELRVFIAPLFLVGALTSIIGVLALRKGHEYYRRTIHKKTVLEHLLGYLTPMKEYKDANLGVATTTGMGEAKSILDDPEMYVRHPLRKGTIARYVAVTLGIVAALNILGLFMAIGWLDADRGSPPSDEPIRGPRVVQALLLIAGLAFLLDRVASFVARLPVLGERIRTWDARSLVVLALAVYVCWNWKIDGIASLLGRGDVTLVGELLTAAVIAGCSPIFERLVPND